ncbi:hypothetical protein [Streptomyces collinus]|uniref:Uncharacterized protein n=1 Tax=Streptomyces collinus (strain DSM 40733 / Tue 365) TaxID=1214242 RepID=S5V2W7_STRC3|nr:hypothetical protein [Streptomyces collinus]AGS73948.1 hypothetical protein B446_35948 [Streptomyces collinus Tu 365]
MADDPKDDKGGQGQGQGQGGQGDGIEATVRRILAELLPKAGGRGQAAEHDVTAQVEAAVAKVHEGKEAARVMEEIQARLKAVEDRPVVEKKPKEYRKITLRMWGDDDDD